MSDALSNLTKIFGVADLTDQGHQAFIHTLHKMYLQQDRFEMVKENIEAVKEQAVEAFGQGSTELAAMDDDKDSDYNIQDHDFDHANGYIFRDEASLYQGNNLDN